MEKKFFGTIILRKIDLHPETEAYTLYFFQSLTIYYTNLITAIPERQQKQTSMSETEELDKYLKSKGKCRIQVTGDGWCLIYAWIEAMKVRGLDPEGNAESLAKQACEELQNNYQQYYQKYLTEDDLKEIHNYLTEKQWNSNLVDVIGHALAHVTKVDCTIHQCDGTKELRRFVDQHVPTGQERPEIEVAFLSTGHYDAVGPGVYMYNVSTLW